MITNALKDTTYIYQFGDGLDDNYIFSQTEIEAKFSNSVNLAYSNNNFIDGAVRINSNNTNKINQEEIDVTKFFIGENDDKTLGYSKKVFKSEPKPSFFYQFENKDSLKFFFNPSVDFASMVDPSGGSSQSAQLPLGQANRNFSIKFFASIPYIFECKRSASRYFDHNIFIQNELICGEGGLICGVGGLICGQGISTSKIDFSLFSSQQLQNTFLQCENGKNYPITYSDKFFALDSFGVENSEAVINRTLTTNSEVQVLATNNYNETTAPNEIFIIELNTLLENEWVSVINTNNSSGFKITWKSATSSPATFWYNSAWETCFDSSGNTIDKSNYLIEKLEDEFLYFSAMKRVKYPSKVNYETIKLNKNTTNNQTIKIEILNTYLF